METFSEKGLKNMPNHSERFLFEEETCGGLYKITDTLKDEHMCRTVDERIAKHITKALNIYNVMQNSGPGLHAINPETLESIKTHDL